MRTVRTGIDGTRIEDDVPSVNIVHIPVIVIVHAGRTVQFGFIHPHVPGKVGMVVFHPVVGDGHYHRRVAGSDFPCFEEVDIRTLDPLGAASVVVIVPLLRKSRVVERPCPRTLRSPLCRDIHGLFGQRIPRIEHPDGIDRLHMRDSGQGAQLGLGTRHGQRIVELHVVPEMKAEFPTAFGEPSAFMEHPAHLGSSERSGYPVQLRVTRLHGTARESPHTQSLCVIAQLYPHPSFEYPLIIGSIGLLRYLSVGKRSLRLPDAGENDACQKRHQQQFISVHPFVYLGSHHWFRSFPVRGTAADTADIPFGRPLFSPSSDTPQFPSGAGAAGCADTPSRFRGVISSGTSLSTYPVRRRPQTYRRRAPERRHRVPPRPARRNRDGLR